MTEFRRLYDCLLHHYENDPIPDMLAAKENGSWVRYSTKEVKHTVDQISAGLLQRGITCGDMTHEGRDKVAIIAKNRPEWIMVDLAVQQIGAVLVPIYPTINATELGYVLQDSKVKIVFVNDGQGLEKVMSIRDQVPSIEIVYSFEKAEGAQYWKEVLAPDSAANAAQIKPISDRIGYKDLATIIYTSGTTGKPKGVMLSHENILSNVLACVPCLPPKKNMKALSFLPLNHIFERMISYFYLYTGTAIYYAENMDTIGDNLKEIKPDMFTTVPRLLEKVYEKIMAKGAEQKGIKKALFFWAHKLATQYEINQPLGTVYKLKLAIANKLIFKKWREALGDNLTCIVSGGAACQVRLIRIFTAAQIPILEGYGLTETSPVISVNRYEMHNRKFGTVGPVIDNVSVKIAEDGEILCKGPNVMIGYYKQPETTAETIINGWYHTGDIGTMVENKFLKITDRKKELFKTSGGKYVAPLPIENKLKESRFIEQVIVVGAGQKFVGALIIPSFANLAEWAKENGITTSNRAELIRNPKVTQFYLQLVEGFNQNFNHVEQIRKFELLPDEWSIESGEMTPKLSIKRKVIMEKFSEQVDRIYAS
ncbi:MAG: long-chain fatty acid--CoA ligase [Chitinophagaceae bacterium]|nr:MAG: long-chain fatty acid--CoA ligase [Chitinophagaceae bacterium]